MPYHPELQPRDLELLYPLAHCYRATQTKLEAARFGVSDSTMRKRLNKLAKGRFLCRLSTLIRDVPEITKPLLKWSPGDPAPNFNAVAYAAQKRWRGIVAREQTIYVASNKLLLWYGLRPRPKLKLFQATHDLGVRASYYYCKQAFPHLEFIGEDLFAPRGHCEKVEDGQLVQGKDVYACIEYAGSYRADRCRDFHRDVAERNLRYLMF